MKKQIDINKIKKVNWWMLFLLTVSCLGGVVGTNNMAVAVGFLLILVGGWIKSLQLRTYLDSVEA